MHPSLEIPNDAQTNKQRVFRLLEARIHIHMEGVSKAARGLRARALFKQADKDPDTIIFAYAAKERKLYQARFDNVNGHDELVSNVDAQHLYRGYYSPKYDFLLMYPGSLGNHYTNPTDGILNTIQNKLHIIARDIYILD